MKRLPIIFFLCIYCILSFAEKRRDILVVFDRAWTRSFLYPLLAFDVNNDNADFFYYDVNLDNPDNNGFEMCIEDIRSRYKGSNTPSLCVVMSAANFKMAELLDGLWPGVPILCVGEFDYVSEWDNVSRASCDVNAVRTPLANLQGKLNLTLLQNPPYFKETADMISTLSPDAGKVLFVGGVDYLSRECEYHMRNEMRKRNFVFEPFNVNGRTCSDLDAIYNGMNPDSTVVLCKSVFANGSSNISRAYVEDNMPTFYMDRMAYKGTVGGIAFVPFDLEAYNYELTNLLSEIVLDGKNPSDIPFVRLPASPMVVNREAFDSFGLDSSDIPEDATLERVPASLFSLYGYIVWPFLVLMVMIVAHSFLIRRKNHKLAEAKAEIERMNEEITIARNKAQHDSKMKSVFLQNMGHDIRTPINAIVGFSQVLTLPGVELSEEDRQKCSEYIENNAGLLLMLMDDILNLVDVENGIYKVNKQNASCNAICRSAMKCVESRPQPGVELKCLTELPDDYMIYTDPRRVQQILINFLTNACKHTPHGEIRIGCSLLKPQNKVVFSVTDTGHGIPPEMAHDIFERFKKLDNIEGHGLGLNICSTISSCLGGEVALDTTYTQGARFTFTLDATN